MKSYWAVLSCGAIYYAEQGGSNFRFCGWNPEGPELWTFKWKLLSRSFFGVVYYALHGGSNFWVCEWNPEFSPLKESYQVPISCGTIQYAIQVSNVFEVSRWTNQM